jgi:hypothetical protein
MKKILFIAATVLGLSAQAQTTGTISLSGTVVEVNYIEVFQSELAMNLNVTEGETAATVATVSEHSNSPTGYTIYMNSVNDSNLVNISDMTKATDYMVSYAGGAMMSLGTTDSAVKVVGPLDGLTTADSDVVLAITGNMSASPGDYTDLITVSIAAN